MLKSLYSGVSGLQSHQIAMDVESNNIANVNTVGFKYARANFSNLLAQTNQIATAPQGALGGQNAVQVGLGSTISSMTTIHSQGSIQNTDKNTDVAIQGDGFFVVSADGGNSYKYTRSGDFKFDAGGNFVDNNGFIAQGWLRDGTTGLVDSNTPIQSITIPPGLTTPANASSEITLKANLNAGATVEQYSPTYEITSNGGGAAGTIVGKPGFPATTISEDMGVMFNASGEAFALIPAATGPVTGGQGFLLSTDGGTTFAEFRYTDTLTDIDTNGGNGGTAGITTLPVGGASADAYYFNTVDEFRASVEHWITSNGANPTLSVGATVGVDASGKFAIDNSAGAGALSLSNVGLADANTLENPIFTSNFATLSGSMAIGTTNLKQSQAVNAAVHSSSIDVFDSLGSKHTVKIDFRKTADAVGSQWDYIVSTPNGTDIGGTNPFQNILDPAGTMTFDTNGALAGFNIPAISFTANNGSTPNQQIELAFGSINGFDGMTSFDSQSSTSGISQDGYTGGDLLGIRIDQSGTLVGSFSNGRSFGLAQMSMAKFANNEGLTTEGGNVYIQSANSGDPIRGTAATGGRGFIQSSALEASNVDLSRSLTQLIIIQRGYQANGKTITTSDQLLNTLINLKQ